MAAPKQGDQRHLQVGRRFRAQAKGADTGDRIFHDAVRTLVSSSLKKLGEGTLGSIRMAETTQRLNQLGRDICVRGVQVVQRLGGVPDAIPVLETGRLFEPGTGLDAQLSGQISLDALPPSLERLIESLGRCRRKTLTQHQAGFCDRAVRQTLLEEDQVRCHDT
ncbi:MAG: hypothetical protein AB7N70_34015 [Dehalococcoidia bacterium]